MSYRDIAYIVMLFTPITSLIGIALAFPKRKHFKKSHWILFFYLLIALLTDLLSRLIGHLFGNNLVLVPFFGLVELILFSLFYRYITPKKHPFIVGLLITCGILIGINFYLTNWIQPTHFNAYSRVLSGVTIVVLCLWYLGYTFRYSENHYTDWLKLSTGILAYYAIDSLWFVFANFLVNQSLTTVFGLWMIHACATPMFYIFLTHKLCQTGKTQQLLPLG